MKQVMEIIYTYSSNNRIINDKETLTNIVNILIEQNRLKDYVLSLNILEKRDNNYSKEVINTASYDFKTRSMFFYLDGLTKQSKFVLRKYLRYSDNNIVLMQNLTILKTILHEIEHAKQNKMIHDEPQNIISFLVNVSLKLNETLILKKIPDTKLIAGEKEKIAKQIYKEIYEELYQFNPHERLANINSNQAIIDNISDKDILDFERDNLFNLYKRGYYFEKEVIYPLKEFMRIVELDFQKYDCYDEDFDKCLIKSQKKYSWEIRALGGLPLSLEEYSNLSQMLLTNKHKSL